MQRTPRFTNRQVTTMVVALCATVVLAPVGAIAASSSLVTITDPVASSHKAKVDAGGHLLVGDASGPLTIDGSTQPTAPARPFTATATVKATGPVAALVAQRRGRQRLAITSISGFATTSAFQVVRYQSFVVDSSTFACPASPDAIAAASKERDIPLATDHAPMSVAYPSPLVFFATSTSASTSCLYVSSEQVGAGDFDVTTTLNGFWAG